MAVRPRELWRTRRPTIIYLTVWTPFIAFAFAHERGWIA